MHKISSSTLTQPSVVSSSPKSQSNGLTASALLRRSQIEYQQQFKQKANIERERNFVLDGTRRDFRMNASEIEKTPRLLSTEKLGVTSSIFAQLSHNKRVGVAASHDGNDQTDQRSISSLSKTSSNVLSKETQMYVEKYLKKSNDSSLRYIPKQHPLLEDTLTKQSASSSSSSSSMRSFKKLPMLQQANRLNQQTLPQQQQPPLQGGFTEAQATREQPIVNAEPTQQPQPQQQQQRVILRKRFIVKLPEKQSMLSATKSDIESRSGDGSAVKKEGESGQQQQKQSVERRMMDQIVAAYNKNYVPRKVLSTSETVQRLYPHSRPQQLHSPAEPVAQNAAVAASISRSDFLGFLKQNKDKLTASLAQKPLSDQQELNGNNQEHRYSNTIPEQQNEGLTSPASASNLQKKSENEQGVGRNEEQNVVHKDDDQKKNSD